MNLSADPDASLEIDALAQSFNIQDVLIQARCFKVNAPKPHYEIILYGRGESAIVDVALREESVLEELIETSAACFAASIQLKNGF